MVFDVKVQRTRPHAIIPRYQTSGAVGLDLHSAEPALVTLAPGERCLIGAGFAIAIPRGYEGQIRPRSGLAIGYGITVLNAPGTIDPDYRGEIKIPLINLGKFIFEIEPGMRVAQIVICPVARVELEEIGELDETGRGAGGFGSTGS